MAHQVLADNRTRTPPTGGGWVSGLLFRKLAICVRPILSRVQKGAVTMGADQFQRLPVLRILVPRVIDKSLDDFAAVILLAVPAGDLAFVQAAFFHLAFRSAQIPGAVQISRFAAFASFVEFAARLTVRTAATDFLCIPHGSDLSPR